LSRLQADWNVEMILFSYMVYYANSSSTTLSWIGKEFHGIRPARLPAPYDPLVLAALVRKIHVHQAAGFSQKAATSNASLGDVPAYA